MKANELRIGNWIIQEDGEPMQVAAKWFSWMAWDYCQPIPLTKEWLVKFGFTALRKNEWILENRLHDLIMKNDPDIGKWEVILFRSVTYIRSVKIDYVHEVQNLYFAITRNELLLK